MEYCRLLTLTVVACAVLGMHLVCVQGIGKLGRAKIESCYGDNTTQLDPIAEVRVENCTETPPCVMKRGEKYVVEVDFTSPITTEIMKVQAFAQIIIEVPWIGMKTDVCKNKYLECPISAGQKYTYRYPVEVDGNYPRITVDTNWYFKGGADLKTKMACFKVKVQLI